MKRLNIHFETILGSSCWGTNLFHQKFSAFLEVLPQSPIVYPGTSWPSGGYEEPRLCWPKLPHNAQFQSCAALLALIAQHCGTYVFTTLDQHVCRTENIPQWVLRVHGALPCSCGPQCLSLQNCAIVFHLNSPMHISLAHVWCALCTIWWTWTTSRGGGVMSIQTDYSELFLLSWAITHPNVPFHVKQALPRCVHGKI